jgi:Kef-type K+ transport system membrane component KefB
MVTDLTFLLQALVIITLPLCLSRALRLSGVIPLVVVQILLGIALGPSLLGRIAPELYEKLFNPSTLGPLSGAATIAVLFFAFITGLHVDLEAFRGRGRAFAAIAAASIVIPSSLGIVVGLLIGIRHPSQLRPGQDLIQFACAIGICLGVTALPVLGAILKEMNLLGRRIADIALGVAAVNDAALWFLLCGLMTGIAGDSPEQPGILFMASALPTYCVAMWFVVRPLLTAVVAALIREEGSISESALAIVGTCVIGSAVITQIIGLHFIFGAFVAGAIVPRTLRPPILDRVQAMTSGVLMPFFFVLTGLRTTIDPSSGVFVEILVVTTVVGVIGKVGGTTLTAVVFGETWSSALCLGTLVQTKGLMEVVVLTVLLERGIISSVAFSALVVMAVISTAPVMPLVRVFLSRTEREAAGAKAAEEASVQIAVQRRMARAARH